MPVAGDGVMLAHVLGAHLNVLAVLTVSFSDLVMLVDLVILPTVSLARLVKTGSATLVLDAVDAFQRLVLPFSCNQPD